MYRRNTLYPDYLYVDNKRYFHPEYKVFDELFQSVMNKNRTIEPVADYLEHISSTKEHLFKVFTDAVGRYDKVGAKTKASTSFNEELPTEAVTIKLESIRYIYIVTRLNVPFIASLTDIHDAKAFFKIPSAPGSIQKVCICP